MGWDFFQGWLSSLSFWPVLFRLLVEGPRITMVFFFFWILMLACSWYNREVFSGLYLPPTLTFCSSFPGAPVITYSSTGLLLFFIFPWGRYKVGDIRIYVKMSFYIWWCPLCYESCHFHLVYLETFILRHRRQHFYVEHAAFKSTLQVSQNRSKCIFRWWVRILNFLP
jgi:hypothetical protein